MYMYIYMSNGICYLINKEYLNNDQQVCYSVFEQMRFMFRQIIFTYMF